MLNAFFEQPVKNEAQSFPMRIFSFIGPVIRYKIISDLTYIMIFTVGIIFFASITNLMGWHIADILLPARIKQLKEKILIIR